MNNWYIIFVLNKNMEKINEYLNKKGLNSFIPKRSVIFKRKQKRFIVNKALFRNYIFVRSSMEQLEFVHLINNLRSEITGIIKVLTYDKDGTPALKAEEREFLSRLFGDDLVVTTSCGYLVNDRVLITEGPLLGYDSKIVALNKHKNYVKLAVDLFGRETFVEVPIEIIEKSE
ncbi:MAG: transcription termination/antitermination NusG family protein [Erysipelotrichaceae bacterium]|nr:transcription termination/antitermination NusG family protein [Erysipelotrichaceae bacterium]